MSNQKQIHEELGAMYDNRKKWLKVGNMLLNKEENEFYKALEKSPLLRRILILALSANLGIYLLLFLAWTAK